MKPEKLTLRNIGPFRGTHTVNFGELGDIFLIYGKTGAGKTTIFDAISYAFYGDAPGERKGIAKAMRSQFARDDEESAVELMFTLAGNRYRIRRTLPLERIGVRSKKLQTVAEEVSFEREIDGVWRDRSSTNKSETDRAIVGLVGLSQEEFSRIVLLPQGEFARFLHQNSTERKAVLSKLFPVDIYSRVTALARERARVMTARQKETEQNLRALDARFDAALYPQERDRLSGILAHLREEQAGLRRELAERTAALQKARDASERARKLAEERAGLAILEHRKPETDALRAELAAARKAEPLRVQAEQLAALAEERKRLAASLDGISAGLERERADLTALEAREAEMTALAAEREKLLVRRDRLRIAVDIALGLETETVALRETSARKAALAKDIASLKKETAAWTARRDEIASDSSLLDARTHEASLLRDALERKKQERAFAEEYGTERKAAEAHAAAAANARAQLETTRRDTGIAKAELADLEAAAAAAHERDLAAALAEGLADGKPCPVCGSLAHPAPAAKGEAAAFDLEDRISAARRHVETLSGLEVRQLRELAAREAGETEAKARLASLVDRYGIPAGQAVPALDEAARALQDAVTAMQNASDALNRSRAAWREAEELRAKIAESERRIASLAEQLAAIDLEEAEQKSSIAHKQARFREAFTAETDTASASAPEVSRTGASIPGAVADPSDAADSLERCESRLLEIDATRTTRDEKLKAARARVDSLSGQSAASRQSLDDLDRRLAGAETRFAAACGSAGFSGTDEALAAARTPDEEKRLETAIAAFDEELSAARSRADQLSAEVSQWTGPEPGAAESAVAQTDAKITDAGNRYEETAAELSELESLKSRHDELAAEHAERAAAAACLAGLDSDLNGGNGLKISFDAWVLGIYLEEITSYANTRLERMSEGRYRIQLNDSYRRGNSQTGLDLEIRDAYTGKTRPSATLSGGETFMASISLALGLADSIQARSGGVQLDAVFIDEGFGTLDEASLERAIGILDEIRGTRMVGIISHVADLRARIPNRIEIVKTGAGSSIRKETFNE